MSRRVFIVLSLVADAAIFNAAIVAAYLLRFAGHLPAFNVRPYVTLSPLLTLTLLATGYIYGLYEPERTEGFWQALRAVLSAVTLTTVLTLVILQLSGQAFDAFPRLVVIIAAPVQAVFLLGWRLLAMKVTPISWPEQRVLIVGTGRLAKDLAAELSSQGRWGYHVVGHVARDESERAAAESSGMEVAGTVADLASVVAACSADRIIVTSPVALRELVEDVTLSGEADVRIDVVPELYEIFIGKVDSIVADIPLMEITRRSASGWYASSKDAIDIAVGLLLLVALGPIMLVTALAVLVTMGRPVLFLQERVGKDQRRFRVVKFRTMVRDAEAGTGAVLAEEDDPRITPLGRFMRTARLDELPQLFNVVRGEMSFVGPRPERPVFVERFVRDIPGYAERFRVKPGITGLAQVCGHYATTPERKLKYDLIYMYHQNLLMDVQVFVDTLRVILTGRGAR